MYSLCDKIRIFKADFPSHTFEQPLETPGVIWCDSKHTRWRPRVDLFSCGWVKNRDIGISRANSDCLAVRSSWQVKDVIFAAFSLYQSILTSLTCFNNVLSIWVILPFAQKLAKGLLGEWAYLFRVAELGPEDVGRVVEHVAVGFRICRHDSICNYHSLTLNFQYEFYG